jgi:hypothetical protein
MTKNSTAEERISIFQEQAIRRARHINKWWLSADAMYCWPINAGRGSL